MKSLKRRVAKKSLQSAELGQFFKSERIKACLSSKTVASYLNISPEVLESYELGLSSIPLNHIYGLSNCLNISPEEVIEKLDR